jgi:hypothetical protein
MCKHFAGAKICCGFFSQNLSARHRRDKPGDDDREYVELIETGF